jgi:hypothetical protein
MRVGIVVLAAALAFTPAAGAGGSFADLAVHGNRVWFVGEVGVRELDARTGRTIAAPQLTGAAYPLSVGVAGGAAWIASVANGYVDGTLTRIDLRTHRTRVVWQRAGDSAQYVAAGAGDIYLLIGRRGPYEIARFTLQGRLKRVWNVRDGGRMAADAAGCWISANAGLLHIDPQGRERLALRASFADLATGDGSVWLAQERSIVRFDERSGRTHTLRTGPLRLGGFQHDIAVGDGALWTLRVATDSGVSWLERRDLGTGRLTGRARVPPVADAIAVTATAVWVATGAGDQVTRFDPRTLRRTLEVTLY